MQVYCIMNSVACYMFRPPIVPTFREVFFEGWITSNVTTVYRYKMSTRVKGLKAKSEYKISIKPFLLNRVFMCCVMLRAFQVQVLIWTGNSGSNPERAHGDKVPQL